MKIWYPTPIDLKNYIETFTVENRPYVKLKLKSAILLYNKLLCDKKSKGQLSKHDESFGGFLNFLDNTNAYRRLSNHQNDIYGFSGWTPSVEDWEWYIYKGYWKELIDTAILECVFHAGDRVITDSGAYFISFLLRKYDLTTSCPDGGLPYNISLQLQHEFDITPEYLISIIPLVRQAWFSEELLKPQHLFYHYLRSFLISEGQFPAACGVMT